MRPARHHPVRGYLAALAVAMSALVAPRVQAQQPALPAPPNIPPSSVLPLNQPLTYRYSDSDGFGSITLTDLGADMATGGDQIQVSIVQNGARYDGSGIIVPLVNAPRPLNILITFTVMGPAGVYFFQGKMGLGVEFQGSGTYHAIANPAQSSPWGLLALPFPSPVPTPTPGPIPGGTSGIRGVAMEGPIFPVERPGQPNSRPLPGAIITVQPAGGGSEIARQQADASGQFQIPLSPGTYLIVPLPPQPGSLFPRGLSQTVTVPAGAFLNVTVQYDTGIR